MRASPCRLQTSCSPSTQSFRMQHLSREQPHASSACRTQWGRQRASECVRVCGWAHKNAHTHTHSLTHSHICFWFAGNSHGCAVNSTSSSVSTAVTSLCTQLGLQYRTQHLAAALGRVQHEAKVGYTNMGEGGLLAREHTHLLTHTHTHTHTHSLTHSLTHSHERAPVCLSLSLSRARAAA